MASASAAPRGRSGSRRGSVNRRATLRSTVSGSDLLLGLTGPLHASEALSELVAGDDATLAKFAAPALRRRRFPPPAGEIARNGSTRKRGDNSQRIGGRSVLTSARAKSAMVAKSTRFGNRLAIIGLASPLRLTGRRTGTSKGGRKTPCRVLQRTASQRRTSKT